MIKYDLLQDAQQLIRDLRGVAFVGSRVSRAADPLLRRCNEVEERITEALEGDKLRHAEGVCVECDCESPETNVALISNDCPLHG